MQPQLSLTLAATGDAGQPTRFTIVGSLGAYVPKPPTPHYPSLPEVEDLTMHLAALAGLATVPHGLLRLEGGRALAHIIRRIDQYQGQKVAMEDMCQLIERLAEYKYDGSHEQVAKAILRYSTNPGLDVVNYYELVLFSFLNSFLSSELRQEYHTLLERRFAQLGLLGP